VEGCYVYGLDNFHVSWIRTRAQGKAFDVQAPSCQRKLIIFGSWDLGPLVILFCQGCPSNVMSLFLIYTSRLFTSQYLY